MNSLQANRASGAGIGLLLASIVFIGLVFVVKFSVNVPDINADRAAVRSKDLAEIRATETAALDHAGWIDQQRGFVRLPIATAIQLTAQNGSNPAQARADLIARAEKAAAPAPKAPEKPIAFE
jgi:hypothetical protein